jgi:DNA-binding response OmpR family regulator
MTKILLLGLESDLERQLARVLHSPEHDVRFTDSIESALRMRNLDIVFAGGDGPDYRDIVKRLRAGRPDARVVLVNRLPDNTRWLDALELGAADYCGAPFESVQMDWLIESVMRQPRGAGTQAAQAA